MARYRPVGRFPKFIAVVLDAQIQPGSFEYALDYLVDHELDLSALHARYNNDEPVHRPTTRQSSCNGVMGSQRSHGVRSFITESWGQVFHYHVLICIQIMARPLRLEFARALYHRTSRSDSREDTYHDDAVCLTGGYDNNRPDPSFLLLPRLPPGAGRKLRPASAALPAGAGV